MQTIEATSRASHITVCAQCHTPVNHLYLDTDSMQPTINPCGQVGGALEIVPNKEP